MCMFNPVLIIHLLQRRGWYTWLALSVLPSVIFSVPLFSAIMHHIHFKLGMVVQLWSYTLLLEFRSACFYNLVYFFRHNTVRLKVKLFVCPRPPNQQFTPRLKKLYSVFDGKKYFYRLLPKRPIACQESGFNRTCLVVLWTHAFLRNL